MCVCLSLSGAHATMTRVFKLSDHLLSKLLVFLYFFFLILSPRIISNHTPLIIERDISLIDSNLVYAMLCI
jgi:hypothetical protein